MQKNKTSAMQTLNRQITKNSNMQAKFWEHVRANLAVADWEALNLYLKCSPHRLTKLKNGNQDFTIEEIKILAELIGEDPIELTHTFRLGYSKATIDEMTRFAEEYNQIFKVQFNAA